MKVIWFANTNSEFEKLIEQINKIVIKNGAFDIIILSGEVFDKQRGISGLKLISDSFSSSLILILDISPVGNLIKHIDSNETKGIFNEYYQIYSNTLILKNSGLVNIKGLNIAFLQGYESSEINKNKFYNNKIYYSSYFKKSDYLNLIEKNDKHIDILILNTLPQLTLSEILSSGYLEMKDPKLIIDRQSLTSKYSYVCNSLMNALSPRYCLIASGEDFYFERTPFLNKKISNILTRVVHLSTFPFSINKKNNKEKFLYALNIEPSIINNEVNPKLVLLSEEDIIKSGYKSNPFDNCDIINFNNNVEINSNEIYVGNIHTTIKEDQLYDFLKKFGEIEKLVYPSKDNYHQGYAFVSYVNNSEIQKDIILQSNKHILNGRKIIFDYRTKSTEKEELSCWFCLNNIKIDKELIINSHTYLYFYVAFPK